MKKLRAWFKELREIVLYYQIDRKQMIGRIVDLENIMRERTDIHADIHFKDASTVIVCGRYRNTDYVRAFRVQADDMSHLVEQLKSMERYATVRTLDTPPQVREFISRQLRSKL